jgi:exodeoxyribonuclease V beta subunit
MTAPLFEPFDVYRAELDRPTLIEASAGTGKTWAIGGLYVRLVVESGLAVENILVVTYTKAATAELSGRIRNKLADMLAELKGHDSGDVFCRTYREDIQDESRAIRRLTHALRCFDDAAIFTIHGFCQRVLTESAFESGMEFDTELIPDESEILRDIVDDYWRREIQPASGKWVDFLVAGKQTPDMWLNEMRPHIGKQAFLALSPLAAPGDLSALEAELDATYAAARALWQAQRDGITGLLLECPGLNGVSYRKSSLPAWFGSFDAYFAAATAGQAIPEKLVKLTPAELQVGKGTKKNCTPPEHPFFAACDALLSAADRLDVAFTSRLSALKADLLHYCEEELPARKRSRQLVSYNDLLNRLNQALHSAHGEHLAEVMRARYPAALIDEFQDTDPIQYGIFRRLYRGQALPVFFVGDPKQAIYGFRGADVYTYLQAYADTPAHKTQNTNQRSIPALIAAVNALFDNEIHARPFLVENIGYRKVEPTTRYLGELAVDGDAGAALRFQMFAGQGEGEKPLNKEAANALAARAVATEIAQLLNLAAQGRAHLTKNGETRPLCGGDIAVLVPAHRQGRMVQEELAKRRVPSVRYGQENVFAAHEALELERVLLAVSEPGRDALVKAALATELMGESAAEIFALGEDEHAAERVFDAFRRYHELWRDHGFMRFFRAWLDERGVARRLLRFQDGERRLTNLLHLAELAQVESRARQGMDALLGWLSRAVRNPRSDDEAALLRLESDAERVKIVTIHASKGLEYPIVFCPFLWDGKLWQKNETAVTFHDAQQNNRPTLDLGSPEYELHKAAAGEEKLAEKLRLLYVALTRAQHRCYVVWGNVKEMETSALAWLLHGGGEAAAAEIEQEIRVFAARADGSVQIDALRYDDRPYLPAPSAATVLAVLPFRRSLYPGWRMTSFSALTAGRHSEAPDYDAAPIPLADAPLALDIFAFPRGANAGTCLHAIFEGWDFTRRDAQSLQAWVAEQLRAHFIEEKWAPVVACMVQATLDAPLDHGAIRLADVNKAQRLIELGFVFPLDNLDVASLRRLLADPALGVAPEYVEAAATLDFRRIDGYMMGFVDLVFAAQGRYYIVDYKSNWLGGETACYAPPLLVRAMADAHYYLQYLIYCVALHRYLRARLADYDYERHFGGVFYLFLRGIAPGTDSGIYRSRPNVRLIEALDRMMDGNA